MPVLSANFFLFFAHYFYLEDRSAGRVVGGVYRQPFALLQFINRGFESHQGKISFEIEVLVVLVLGGLGLFLLSFWLASSGKTRVRIPLRWTFSFFFFTFLEASHRLPKASLIKNQVKDKLTTKSPGKKFLVDPPNTLKCGCFCSSLVWQVGWLDVKVNIGQRKNTKQAVSSLMCT